MHFSVARLVDSGCHWGKIKRGIGEHERFIWNALLSLHGSCRSFIRGVFYRINRFISAGEDIKDGNEIRPRLEDIHDLRRAKIMLKIKDLDIAQPAKTQMSNIASEELTGIRETYCKALNVVYQLNTIVKEGVKKH